MNTRVVLRGLFVVGLVVALCTYGLAAGRATNQEPNQGAAAQQGQSAARPGAAQPGATQPGATQPGMAQERAPSGQMAQGMTLERTSQLIGKDVKSTQGEKLGVIHDIVLNPDYQQVSYVALSSGGTFGMGSKLHAIPWQALHIGPKGEITTSLTKQQLAQSPGFPNNDWPSQADMRLLGAGAATTGSEAAKAGTAGSSASRAGAAGSSATSPTPGNQAAAEAPPSATGAAGQTAMANQSIQIRRVTHLTGMKVRNPENEDLGDLEDFSIDVSNGHIAYDIIRFGGVAGIGEKYAAVPANAVRLEPQTHVALLNATKSTLESVALKPDEFSKLSNPQYMQQLSKTFPAAPAGRALGYVPPSPQMQLVADEKAWSAESPHGKSFNPSAVKTMRGTVESVGMFKPEGAPAGTTGGLRLRVKTSEGRTETVYAGPISYAERNNFFVMPGDEITITGSESKSGTRTMIIASELRKGNQTLRLRDQSGKPLWTMGQPSGPAATRPGAGPSGTAGQSPSRPPSNQTRQE